MSHSVTLAAPLETVASPQLWIISIAVLLVLLAADFFVTRKPHDVAMREAVGWSVFYLTLPAIFGLVLWWAYGSKPAVEFYTGFVVEKSLSVDNLFVFMLLLGAFAVPSALAQRVLLYGIAGALVLRGVFIALGAAVLQAGTWAFLLFGAVLLVTAIKVMRDARKGEDHEVDIDNMRSVKLLRRFFPVTKEYHGSKMVIRQAGRRVLTPLAVVVVAVFMTDIVFAVDSVPAVYGVTEDPYLVFATNAFALMGLRALYFVLRNVLDKLRHLDYGLAVILAFIGVKLVLHWAHGVWTWLPEVPTLASLGVIAVTLITVTITSMLANRRDAAAAAKAGSTDPVPAGTGTPERESQGA
ncbi:TerC family protein [Actinoplanes sp. Pm04-4]|uniref:TerC family protein n=1 Tax=Paractinoplanes pyxinae TaxID=2997416 RepID=A0ABT4AS65_9ACTN|nr:TerC family protein [Actinoplanes pyxinae]MCY1137093.1 TerC family protein [Actinoplanes pyxinae]